MNAYTALRSVFYLGSTTIIVVWVHIELLIHTQDSSASSNKNLVRGLQIMLMMSQHWKLPCLEQDLFILSLV